MNYEVIVSEPAEAEAEEAFIWLNRLTVDFSAVWYDGLLDAIASLSAFPNRCPIAPENKDFPDNWENSYGGSRKGAGTLSTRSLTRFLKLHSLLKVLLLLNLIPLIAMYSSTKHQEHVHDQM